MTDMRFSVCGRRTVIEDIGLIALMLLDGFFENIFPFPKLLDFFLPFHKVHIGIYFFKHDSLLH